MGDEQKSILIIGAGVNQMPIIKKAKEKGYYVHVVTPYETDPGVEIADKVFMCNILNMDEIVSYGKKHNIKGVITDLSDIATPVAAYVAEKIGLPGYGYENALYFTDKYKMREAFKKIGLPVAENARTVIMEEALKAAKKIGYPVVIKPADSFSSRGVCIVHDSGELKQHYAISMGYSRCGVVIVEKYISGSQYFSQGYVENGKLRLFAFSDRYYHDLPDICVPYTNAFPALINEQFKSRMTYAFSKVIDYLKPQFGQVWAEWIYDEKEDELYIIEMAIRGAGAEVTTRIIPNAYGIDTECYLLEDAVGEKHNSIFEVKMDSKASAFYSFLLPEGEIIKIEGLDGVLSIDGIEFADIKDMYVGDKVQKYKDKTSRYGLIVIKAETREEIDKIWNLLKNKLHIFVKTESGIQDIIWE